MTKAQAIDTIMRMTEKQKERLKLVKKLRDERRGGDLTKKVGAQDIAPHMPGRSVGTTQRYLDILEASERVEPAEQPAAAPSEPVAMPPEVQKVLDEMAAPLPRLGPAVIKSIQTAMQEEHARGQLLWNGQNLAFETTVAEITERLSTQANNLEVATLECEVKTDKICELESLQAATAAERDAFASSLGAAKAEIQTLKSEHDMDRAKIGFLEQHITVIKGVLNDANRELEKYRKDAPTIFEMKVQCRGVEQQRDAAMLNAEELRSTIGVMKKTHEQTLAHVHDEDAAQLHAAHKRIFELENKLMEAFTRSH